MSEAPRDAQELVDPDARVPVPEDGLVDAPQKTNDPVALRKKALSDENQRLKDDSDLRAVLATQPGVRLLARIMGICGWNQPYFHPSNSYMCEIAGRRSVGFQLENWVSDADLDLWFKVRRELEGLRPKPKKKSGAA